jgi:hypothetical protein
MNKNLQSKTSKFLEKSSDSIYDQKVLKFIQNTSTLEYLTEAKKQNIDLRHQEKLQFKYYLLTKNNLHSILLKKLFLNSKKIKSLKHLNSQSAETVSKVLAIYNIQKKFIKQEQQFPNIKIGIDKSNLFNFVHDSKSKF